MFQTLSRNRHPQQKAPYRIFMAADEETTALLSTGQMSADDKDLRLAHYGGFYDPSHMVVLGDKALKKQLPPALQSLAKGETDRNKLAQLSMLARACRMSRELVTEAKQDYIGDDAIDVGISLAGLEPAYYKAVQAMQANQHSKIPGLQVSCKHKFYPHQANYPGFVELMEQDGTISSEFAASLNSKARIQQHFPDLKRVQTDLHAYYQEQVIGHGQTESLQNTGFFSELANAKTALLFESYGQAIGGKQGLFSDPLANLKAQFQKAREPQLVNGSIDSQAEFDNWAQQNAAEWQQDYTNMQTNPSGYSDTDFANDPWEAYQAYLKVKPKVIKQEVRQVIIGSPENDEKEQELQQRLNYPPASDTIFMAGNLLTVAELESGQLDGDPKLQNALSKFKGYADPSMINTLTLEELAEAGTIPDGVLKLATDKMKRIRSERVVHTGPVDPNATEPPYTQADLDAELQQQTDQLNMLHQARQRLNAGENIALVGIDAASINELSKNADWNSFLKSKHLDLGTNLQREQPIHQGANQNINSDANMSTVAKRRAKRRKGKIQAQNAEPNHLRTDLVGVLARRGQFDHNLADKGIGRFNKAGRWDANKTNEGYLDDRPATVVRYLSNGSHERFKSNVFDNQIMVHSGMPKEHLGSKSIAGILYREIEAAEADQHLMRGYDDATELMLGAYVKKNISTLKKQTGDKQLYSQAQFIQQQQEQKQQFMQQLTGGRPDSRRKAMFTTSDDTSYDDTITLATEVNTTTTTTINDTTDVPPWELMRGARDRATKRPDQIRLNRPPVKPADPNNTNMNDASVYTQGGSAANSMNNQSTMATITDEQHQQAMDKIHKKVESKKNEKKQQIQEQQQEINKNDQPTLDQ